MPPLGLGVVNIEDIHRAILRQNPPFSATRCDKIRHFPPHCYDKIRHFPPHTATKSAIFRHTVTTKSAIFRHTLRQSPPYSATCCDKVRHIPPHTATKSAIFRHTLRQSPPFSATLLRQNPPFSAIRLLGSILEAERVLCAFCARKTNFFAHKHFRLYAMSILYTAFAGWSGDSKAAVLVFGCPYFLSLSIINREKVTCWLFDVKMASTIHKGVEKCLTK